MAYLGEKLSIGVAVLWTVASLWSEIGSKRLGAQVMNTWRLGFSILGCAVFCWIFLGALIRYMQAAVLGCGWLSGFIGFSWATSAAR